MTKERAYEIAKMVIATGTDDEQFRLWNDSLDEPMTRKEFLEISRDGDGRYDLDDWVAGMSEVEDATDDADWDDESLDLIIDEARDILTSMIEAE